VRARLLRGVGEAGRRNRLTRERLHQLDEVRALGRGEPERAQPRVLDDAGRTDVSAAGVVERDDRVERRELASVHVRRRHRHAAQALGPELSPLGGVLLERRQSPGGPVVAEDAIAVERAGEQRRDILEATEVPAAVTLDECWQLVETAEKTKKHCVMMENCCYDRIELMTLHMVRKGLLGEILHAECGYLHDLREVKFSSTGEGLWRRVHSWKRNGNLYPTHGLGPVSQCLNVNRGDAFDYLVSMSSPSGGMQEYAVEKFGKDSPQAKEKFALGDVNTSLIKTKLGKTIIVIHDTNLPRPYTRINLVQGTKGIAMKWPDRVYVEGKAAKPHEWDDFEKYAAEYEHPLWKKLAQKGEGRGHGGMDYIEDYRLIQSLRTGTPMDMDVYDAAAWSAVTALSERSVAQRGKPQSFPDYTRGKWKTNPPLEIIEG